MGRREQLVKELEGLLEELLEEVSDFAAFLRKRRESQAKRKGLWGEFLAEHRGLRLLDRSRRGGVLLR